MAGPLQGKRFSDLTGPAAALRVHLKGRYGCETGTRKELELTAKTGSDYVKPRRPFAQVHPLKREGKVLCQAGTMSHADTFNIGRDTPLKD